jgi:hypothetical protein
MYRGFYPTYQAIQSDPALLARYTAAVTLPGGGGARAPRKNRTYKKRKASRKTSRKAARIL